MKIHMYEDFPNFGDVLNKYLWPRYFQDALNRDDDILMFGIGTLLGAKIEHPGRIIVCGSGCGYGDKVDPSVRERCEFAFVRGPLTAQMMGLPADKAITDPAILTPECFPPSAKHGRVIFVPHWETSRNPLWKRACKQAGVEYVDPLSDIAGIMAKISGAQLVIAEAMHAAIIADAYRVPWVAVSTSGRINRFKWQDWGNSLEMTPEFHELPPLGASDKFRNMTARNRTLKVDGAANANGAAKSGLPKAIARRLYHTFVPAKIRAKKDHYLLWHIGPAIDGTVGPLISGSRVREAARKLRELSTLPGTVSNDLVAADRRAKLQMRLQETRDYLKAAA